MTSSNPPRRVALVTGASSGMGKDFCLRLLREGYLVYGAARRVPAMADIVAAGGVALGMDVTDDASLVAGVDRILREGGRIDVLVNNAGYGAYGAIAVHARALAGSPVRPHAGARVPGAARRRSGDALSASPIQSGSPGQEMSPNARSRRPAGVRRRRRVVTVCA